MQNCKLFVFSNDELTIIQCRSENPASFVVETSSLNDELIATATFIRLEWFEESSRHCVPVTIKSYGGSSAILNPMADVKRTESEQFHLIEMSEPVDLIKISEDDIHDFRMRAYSINGRSRNSITAQIKHILLDETVTNQIILKMLMQIDDKLDELLSIKQSNDIEGLKRSRILCLSGGGACFKADTAEKGDIFYVQSLAQNVSSGYALLCRVIHTIPSKNGVICETEFVGIDETTREAIIRLVFEKDREKLKRKKVNG